MHLDPGCDRPERSWTHIPAPARVARPDPADSGGPLPAPLAGLRVVLAAGVVVGWVACVGLAFADWMLWGMS